jgi:hypothetical protein
MICVFQKIKQRKLKVILVTEPIVFAFCSTEWEREVKAKRLYHFPLSWVEQW